MARNSRETGDGSPSLFYSIISARFPWFFSLAPSDDSAAGFPFDHFPGLLIRDPLRGQFIHFHTPVVILPADEFLHARPAQDSPDQRRIILSFPS